MNPDRKPQQLVVERVQWIPSSPDEIEVRVYGVWNGASVPPAVTLLVGDSPFDQLPDPPPPGQPPAWSAAFLVPVELRTALEEAGAVLAGPDFVVLLPGAEPGVMDAPPGTVVDPTVLAERRARRAEIAEESAAARAASAEQTVETLRAQLGHLEERVARAGEERDQLAGRVADAERRLRLAEQREEAERRRRGELEEEVVSARRGVEADLEDLRARLAGAEEVTGTLERELDRARRRAEDATRIAEEERAARRSAEELASSAKAEADALRIEADSLRAQAEALRADAESLRAEADTLRGRADEADSLRARADEADALRERAERAEALSAEAEALRERAERAEALAAEGGADDSLRARADLADELREEANELRAEADGLRAEAEGLRARAREADDLREEAEVLRARAAAADTLRARTAELERRLVADPRRGETDALRARAAELERRLAAERQAREEAEALRIEAQALERRLRASTAATADVEALERRAEALEQRLAEEREARAAAERRLAAAPGRSETEHERALIAQVAALETELVRRTAVHGRVTEAIELIRVELGQVREQVRSAGPGRGADAAAVASLRAELVELEERGQALDAALRARGAELDAARNELERARDDAVAARAEAERQRQALESAEQSAAEARRIATDLRERLAAEQAARAAAEQRLGEAATAPSGAAGGTEPPITGDPALDTLIAGLRAQVASAREQLTQWGDQQAPEPPPAVEAPPQGEAPPPGAEAPPLSSDAPPLSSDPPPLRPEHDFPTLDEPLPPKRRAGDAEPPRSEAYPSRPSAADPGDETRRRLQAIAAELRAAVPEEAGAAGSSDVIGDLQRAAERLRAAAEQEFERLDAADAAPPAPPAEPAEESVAVVAREQAVRVATGGAATVTPIGARAITQPVVESPWLRVGIERLAEIEPATAARLFAALLPVQALTGEELAYDVEAPAVGTLRVILAGGQARVEPIERPADRNAVDVVVEGPLAVLAPLAAGDAGWRLKGAQVRGSRRKLWRLMKARRRPVGLAELGLAGAPVHPGLLLSGLAAAVEPVWTRGHRFSVAYAIGGDGTFTVVAADGGPLRVLPETPVSAGEIAATVVVGAPAFMPVLAGQEPPAGETATVVGDRRVVDLLHTWFDLARGVAAQ